MNDSAIRSVDDDIAGRWARALAAREAATLKSLLRPGLDFRALTPGRFWEARPADVEAVVDDTILGTWFSPDRGSIDLLAVEGGAVGPLQHLRYRLRVTGAKGASLVEQVAYVRVDDGRISSLRVLCSGYVPEDDMAATPAVSASALSHP